MPGPEPFQDWLEQFNRDWWRSPEPSSSSTPASFNLDEPPAAPRESELASRLERLAEERARLQQRIDVLTRENAQLQERQSGIETQLAEFNASLSRARQTYEARISQLEGEKGALAAQVQGLLSEKKAAAEVAGLRQEIALFLEEFRIVASSLKRGPQETK